MAAKEAGSGPVNSFLRRPMASNFWSRPMLSGRLPVKWFSEKSNESSISSWPNDSGIVPVKLLPVLEHIHTYQANV